jgi:hypothetical protein
LRPLPVVELLEEIRGPLAGEARERLLRAVRRSFYGALLDPQTTQEELSAEIWRLLDAAHARVGRETTTVT